jgi:hypothetical protein
VLTVVPLDGKYFMAYASGESLDFKSFCSNVMRISLCCINRMPLFCKQLLVLPGFIFTVGRAVRMLLLNQKSESLMTFEQCVLPALQPDLLAESPDSQATICDSKPDRPSCGW